MCFDFKAPKWASKPYTEYRNVMIWFENTKVSHWSTSRSTSINIKIAVVKFKIRERERHPSNLLRQTAWIHLKYCCDLLTISQRTLDDWFLIDLKGKRCSVEVFYTLSLLTLKRALISVVFPSQNNILSYSTCEHWALSSRTSSGTLLLSCRHDWCLFPPAVFFDKQNKFSLLILELNPV